MNNQTIDYTNLRQYLADQNWQKADLETQKLIFPFHQEPLDLAALVRDNEIDEIDDEIGNKLRESLRKYPVSSLQTIDQLWQEYSHNHFGFTVQKQVYEEINLNFKNLNYQHFRQKYANFRGRITASIVLAIEIGWLSPNGDEFFDQEIIYSLNAPRGHLPTTGRRDFGIPLHHGDYLLTFILRKFKL